MKFTTFYGLRKNNQYSEFARLVKSWFEVRQQCLKMQYHRINLNLQVEQVIPVA